MECRDVQKGHVQPADSTNLKIRMHIISHNDKRYQGTFTYRQGALHEV